MCHVRDTFLYVFVYIYNGDIMNYKEIDDELKPRERLIKFGKEALSEYELLAIILNTGIKNMSVYDLAKEILSKYKINELVNISYEELVKIRGISKTKACLIISCFEFVKRSLIIDSSNVNFRSPKDIYNYIISDYVYEKSEKIYCIIVDTKMNLLKKTYLSSGDVNSVSISYKNIIELLIKYNGYGLILCHNHPSNDVRPSACDKAETVKLYKILNELNYLLVDHIIVGKDKYFSFLENNLLEKDFIY